MKFLKPNMSIKCQALTVPYHLLDLCGSTGQEVMFVGGLESEKTQTTRAPGLRGSVNDARVKTAKATYVFDQQGVMNDPNTKGVDLQLIRLPLIIHQVAMKLGEAKVADEPRPAKVRAFNPAQKIQLLIDESEDGVIALQLHLSFVVEALHANLVPLVVRHPYSDPNRNNGADCLYPNCSIIFGIEVFQNHKQPPPERSYCNEGPNRPDTEQLHAVRHAPQLHNAWLRASIKVLSLPAFPATVHGRAA
ncbi:hypothetical protein Psefu_1424 [Pseudomonas fulva 12-X]|uniref:Uncharacterized protein n=1 Tax=Pseudomonas fulva (strain 12-X) TaxID=743720 RepID=F6AFD9_PSEF1|nr:hypothetical protein Psefu_1424 [Pseudomonas fulva 12-X]